jgi:hypothetical protein
MSIKPQTKFISQQQEPLESQHPMAQLTFQWVLRVSMYQQIPRQGFAAKALPGTYHQLRTDHHQQLGM